jgi:hypothetical protein
MGSALRIIGFAVLAAIAFSFLATYKKQSANPTPVPLATADETKPEPPRTVRVIQIYKTPSDQLPVNTPTPPTPSPVEPISAFPETATIALPDTPPSSPPPTTPSPQTSTQKTEDGFCERYHLHKVITNNGKSWRCRR